MITANRPGRACAQTNDPQLKTDYIKMAARWELAGAKHPAC